MRKLVLSLSSAAAVLALASAANAATPMTAFGKPDLSGAWSNASLTPLARAKGVDKLEVSEAEANKILAGATVLGFEERNSQQAAFSDPNAGAPSANSNDFGTKAYDSGWVAPGDHLAKVNGKYRTSNIVEPADGQIPYRDKAAAAKRAEARRIAYATGNAAYENPEDTNLAERCLIGFGGTAGPGMQSVLYNNNYQFVLTKDHLAILVEMAHDARIIPIFESAAKAKASHQPAVIKPWIGDSVAWWEGPTLVVETTSIKPVQGERHPFYLTPEGKVTERLTRTSDNEILYQYTVDDPAIYTQPWKAELAFYPSKGVFEYACHEGNYGLEGILAGARAREAEAAGKAQAGR